MRIILIASTALLAACATSKSTFLPDGRKGHSINCSGAALGWDLCYQKAGELCGSNGYDILAKEGEQGSTITGTQYGVFGTPMVNRTLLISCKSAIPAATPQN